jgi:hypothetical protein
MLIVTVAPFGDRDPAVGEGVLVRCVVATTTSTPREGASEQRFLIGNNRGGINQWLGGRQAIFDVAIGISRRLRGTVQTKAILPTKQTPSICGDNHTAVVLH